MLRLFVPMVCLYLSAVGEAFGRECGHESYNTNVAMPVMKAGNLYFDPVLQRWYPIAEAEVVAQPRRRSPYRSTPSLRANWVNLHGVNAQDPRSGPCTVDSRLEGEPERRLR